MSSSWAQFGYLLALFVDTLGITTRALHPICLLFHLDPSANALRGLRKVGDSDGAGEPWLCLCLGCARCALAAPRLCAHGCVAHALRDAAGLGCAQAL